MKCIKRSFCSAALLTIILFTSCKKLPPLDKLSSDFVVQTKYDNTANFSSYQTFAIRDTIAIATGNPKDSVWYDANAQSIIAEVARHMVAAGYTQVPANSKSGADLGIQLVGIRNKIIYDVSPGYWWGFPGYGDPCYWGDCNGYGYWSPYWYTYSIKTGSIITEIADLKNARAAGKLNVIWTGIGSGQVGDAFSFIADQCIKSINQEFVQSPYLKTVH